MRNARISFILWLLFPLLAAAQLPPLTRSVLTTNIPAFGSAGQALFRISVPPYLNWSNVVASGGLSISDSNNIINLASNYTYAVSNYAYTASNALSGQIVTSSNSVLNASSNYTFSVSNTLAGQIVTASNAVLNAASNYTFAVSNLVVASTNGQFIEKTGGVGTNTTLRQVSQTGPALTIGTNAGATFSIMGVTNGPSQFLGQVGSPMLTPEFGGTNLLTWKTNGCVSIGGPTKTTYRLTVNGNNDHIALVNSADTTAFTTLTVSSSGIFGITPNYPSGGGYVNINQQSSIYGFLISKSSYWGGQGIDGNTNFVISTANATHDTVFNAENFGASTETMRIKGANYSVGIGTNSPLATLHLRSGPTNQYVFQADASNNLALATITTNGILTVKSNVFIGTQMLAQQPIGLYGSMMMNATNMNAYGAAYTNVSGYNVAITNGFFANLTTGDITNNVAGYYRCTISISFAGQNAHLYEGCLLTNGVDPETIAWRGQFDTPSRMRSQTGTGLIYLPAGTRCHFAIKDESGAGDVAINRASIVIGTP